jgi:hypothetical protein
MKSCPGPLIAAHPRRLVVAWAIWRSRSQVSDYPPGFHQWWSTTPVQLSGRPSGGVGGYPYPQRRLDGLCAVRALQVEAPHLPCSGVGSTAVDTDDEGERARYGLYALAHALRRPRLPRGWATSLLQGAGHGHRVLVCGDLNDTLLAATTQVPLGPPGSQLGTGGGLSRRDPGDANRLPNLAPAMPRGNAETGEESADWSGINNGVPNSSTRFWSRTPCSPT